MLFSLLLSGRLVHACPRPHPAHRWQEDVNVGGGIHKSTRHTTQRNYRHAKKSQRCFLQIEMERRQRDPIFCPQGGDPINKSKVYSTSNVPSSVCSAQSLSEWSRCLAGPPLHAPAMVRTGRRSCPLMVHCKVAPHRQFQTAQHRLWAEIEKSGRNLFVRNAGPIAVIQ